MELKDFEDYFWSYMESSISEQQRYLSNKDFLDSVCYDSYRIYAQSDISIDVVCKMAENLFFNIKRYSPNLNY
jgi:hypothetical protein